MDGPEADASTFCNSCQALTQRRVMTIQSAGQKMRRFSLGQPAIAGIGQPPGLLETKCFELRENLTSAMYLVLQARTLGKPHFFGRSLADNLDHR